MGAPAHPGRVVVPGVDLDLGMPKREPAGSALVVVQGQADLLEVVDALDAAGGLARRLHGGQQQRDQDRDDRDDDQQLDQREGGATMSSLHDVTLSFRRDGPMRPLGADFAVSPREKG